MLPVAESTHGKFSDQFLDAQCLTCLQEFHCTSYGHRSSINKIFQNSANSQGENSALEKFNFHTKSKSKIIDQITGYVSEEEDFSVSNHIFTP